MKAFVTTDISPEALQALKDLLQDEVVYESWRDTKNMYFSADDLAAKINEIGAEIFLCEGDNLKKDGLDQVDLKIIGSTRGDPNNIDLNTATEKGIPVLFAPDRNTIAVAECTITLILELLRKISKVDEVLHSKEFHVGDFKDYVTYYNMFKGNELFGKTVGIIGLGRIGFEVAKRLKPFGVHFLIHDPYVQEARLKYINGQLVDINTLMANSDIVSIHCPPTDETDGLVGEEQIKLLKPSALFINLGRASITDEDALYDALKAKKIAGAALDVFNIEPVDEDNEFLELENVIVTPHIGGNTFETNHRHGMMMVDGIKAILNKEVPPNILNPEVLPYYKGIKPGVQVGEEVPLSLEYFVKEIREIIDICQIMIKEGYIVGTAGNVSMRVQLPTGEDAFLLSPSTVKYEEMTEEDVVLTDEYGRVLAGTRNPTSEKMLHLEIFRARDDVSAIIHSHAPFSTTLSIARMSIGPIVDEILPFIGGCEVAEYGLAGTEDLAYKAVKALGNNYALFLANHGNVCCGNSMDHAWTVCQQVELAAKIQYRASLLGTIYALPEEAEESSKEIFEIMQEVNRIK